MMTNPLPAAVVLVYVYLCASITWICKVLIPGKSEFQAALLTRVGGREKLV